ncbi:MAG: N-acetylmuramate alpha-1-phosphate uridylyltransferase MurU [Betaproteobacteria bacterium]
MPAPRTAMILAAGRGERLRPLTDSVPKPLLNAGGKPLIVRQIEALARGGYRNLVINAAHLADQLVAALGDGRAFGVDILWSIEAEALETAGGIATALPLLPPGRVLIVSADIATAFDYATVTARADSIAARIGTRVHLVMVPNPPFHPDGDFALTDDYIGTALKPRLTFGNIGLYDTTLFSELPRGVKLKLLPLFLEWIARGWVSGERYDGPWTNVGTIDDLAALDLRLRTHKM